MFYFLNMGSLGNYERRLRIGLVPFFLVLLLWLVFWFEVRMGFNFNNWGIYPRNLIGLRGIITGVFIHGSASHLYQNSVPLAVLLFLFFYFFPKRAWQVLVLGWLLSGFLTWIIGRGSYHIGASGIIYYLASFIFFSGVISRYYKRMALSLVVVFLYGGMVWYVFPVKEQISWEGHLSGTLCGLALAWLTPNLRPLEKQFDWQDANYDTEADPFMKHFDREGNFISESEMEATLLRDRENVEEEMDEYPDNAV